MLFRLPVALLLPLMLLFGCDEPPAPPVRPLRILPTLYFEGLPLAGTEAVARRAGFSDCGPGVYGLRCRKPVTVMGVGPLIAAVDLIAAKDGEPLRFDHVTLFHESDQSALVPLGDALKAAGWQSCLGPDDESYGRPGSPFRIAIDTNYWGKRRGLLSIERTPFKRC